MGAILGVARGQLAYPTHKFVAHPSFNELDQAWKLEIQMLEG